MPSLPTRINLPSFPLPVHKVPSVLSVLEADRNGGNFSPIRSAAIGEYEIPMDVAVVGSRTLTIDVDARPGR